MVAMTAASLNEPALAIDALAMVTPKNTWLPNGHNWQRANLPLYLPGNGGLLLAIAHMVRENAFPKNWNVRARRLSAGRVTWVTVRRSVPTVNLFDVHVLLLSHKHKRTFSMKKLWISFAVVLVVSFAVLSWIGTRIYQEMPPIPDQVVSTDGKVVIASGDIGRGQNVWQALGGMEVGSDLGTRQLCRAGLDRRLAAPRSHVRPRRLVIQGFRQAVRAIAAEDKAKLRGRLEDIYRANTLRCGHRRDSHRPGARPRL